MARRLAICKPSFALVGSGAAVVGAFAVPMPAPVPRGFLTSSPPVSLGRLRPRSLRGSFRVLKARAWDAIPMTWVFAVCAGFSGASYLPGV